jgi:hypothetical protein
MRVKFFLGTTTLVLVIFALVTASFAQEDCFTRVNRSVATTLENCAAMNPNEICAGAGSVAGINGSQAIQSVQQISTAPDADEIGMAVVNLSLPSLEEDEEPSTTALFVFGNTTLTSSDPSWHAFSIDESGAVCRGSARLSGVLIQVPDGFTEQLQVNGTNIAFSRTIFITLVDSQLVVNVLEGDATVQANTVFAGFQWTQGTPSPYDAATMATLPVNLLPRIVRVALPGQVTLASQTSLFAEARDSSRIVIEEMLPGTPLNVYGADLTGQWRHVVDASGLVGWVPVASLQSDLNTTIPAYEATPHLLTRPFGPTYGRGGTGFGQVNLRIGPSDEEGILAQLSADTEFSILGRNTSLDWIYIQLDEAINGTAEGWVFVPVIDLPPDYRIGELPLAP